MRVMLGLVLMGGLLSGCMNITARTQPEQADVPIVRQASDCVPIFFGLAFGEATVEAALAKKVSRIADQPDDLTAPRQLITKVRSVSLHDYQFLFFGARCVEVVGE